MNRIRAKLQASQAPTVDTPRVATFEQFLLEHARVPVGGGQYGPYTFEGREALREIVQTLDDVLGRDGAAPLKDSTLAIAGGAQFGKSCLEQNLAGYLTGCRFLNAGVYLPDDKLADSIVDTKFRPDVVDQIPWFATMTQVGKSVNKSGKAVNTKGAFLVTDGERKAVGMFRGLQRVPTSFSLDVVIRDEEDDIPRDKAKFLSGRLTASALRLQIIVGTQRVHGAGQNKQWEQGSQGIMLIGPALMSKAAFDAGSTDGWINPEDHWPQVCRVQMGRVPSADDPQLTYEGDFKRPGSSETVATYTPDGNYYLAHPDTGAALNRNRVVWSHLRPERIALRRWSWRISQLGIPAIDLAQIVAHWTRAVADAEEMISFCCDRLARPKSTSQALTPEILDRARRVEPFDYGAIFDGPRYGGLDMGDRCWLLVNQDCSHGSRVIAAHKIAAGDVVSRVVSLYQSLGLSALLIDERPLVNEARTLAMVLNGLQDITWPRVPDWKSADCYVSLPGGLAWDGRNQVWRNLRCAVVRFTKTKLGAGIGQTAVEFDESGVTKFVPAIECNRFETIDGAVREFLTPTENVIDVVNGKLRTDPACLLPLRKPGSPAILETLDSHLLAGSQRAKDEKTGEPGDYMDGIENHFMLARGYGRLARLVAGPNRAGGKSIVKSVQSRPRSAAMGSRKVRLT